MEAGAQRTGLPRWVWILVGLAAAGLALYELKAVLTPIFFAFLIAYFFDPVVDRFERRGVPRALGIVILLVLVLGAAGLTLLLVVPLVVREVVEFRQELPAKIVNLRSTVEPWLVAQGVPVPHTMDEAWALFGDVDSEAGALSAQDVAERAAPALRSIGNWVWGRTTSAIAVVASLLLVPVFAFYLLYDFDRMTEGARDLVPHRYRPFVVDVAREIDSVLGQFVRGQLLVMLALAVLYAVGYSIARVPLAIPIGIVAGLLAFIPYVGGAVALILALVMVALGWEGWWQLVGVGIAYGVIQLLEGFVITPRIVGDKVGLPAIWVLVALMVGGELFGFLGVLLAVPAAAVAKIFVVRAVAYYRKTELYLAGAPEDRGGAFAGILEEEGLPDSAPMMAAKAHADPRVPVVGEVGGDAAAWVAAAEAGGAADIAREAEGEAGTESETESESESESESETETESGSETETESETESETETGTETESETGTETGTETESETGTEPAPGTETRTGTGTEPETGAGTGTEPETPPELDAATRTAREGRTASQPERKARPGHEEDE